jgi:DNA-binding PadR family transcriptional regulator
MTAFAPPERETKTISQGIPCAIAASDISSLDISVDNIARTCHDGPGKGGPVRRDPVAPSEFLPLPTAAFHILLALRNEEKHGYAIMRDVEALSDGAVKIGPGTMYGSIKRMLADGLIEESEERPDPDMDDERRRYYRCTGLGERVCSAEVQRLTKLLKNAFPRGAIPGMGRA